MTREQLTAKMDQINTTLNTRIDDVQTSLKMTRQELLTKINQESSSLRQDLSTKIDQESTSLRAAIYDVEIKLGKRIDKVEDRLGNLEEGQEDLKGEVQSLSHKMDAVGARLDHHDEEIALLKQAQ